MLKFSRELQSPDIKVDPYELLKNCNATLVSRLAKICKHIEDRIISFMYRKFIIENSNEILAKIDIGVIAAEVEKRMIEELSDRLLKERSK